MPFFLIHQSYNLPGWEIVYDQYPAMFSLLKNKQNMIPLLATRGCPYSCRFYCTYPLQQGIKVRQRNPLLILEEMKYWKTTTAVTDDRNSNMKDSELRPFFCKFFVSL